MEKDIEKAAALALLDRGIAFRIPAPWWLQRCGKKDMKITVKRLRLGTLVHLSALEEMATLEPMKVGSERDKVIKEMGNEPLTLPYKVITGNVDNVTMQVACCLLNSKLKIKLFSYWFSRYLRWAVHPDQLQELVMWLFIYGRAESFTNTTKLIARMRMTKPMNLGQD